MDLTSLLGRDPIRVDLTNVTPRLAGKRVLITGGAGSIGRDLAATVASLEPERLVLLDRAESALHLTELGLRKRFPRLALSCHIGDILDRSRVNEVAESCRAGVVFHAAAYKHVPMMEANPAEAFKNNVLGTRNVAQAAAAAGVERFILISTDKAVNPASVMGATKRLAERLLHDVRSGTRFISVRFGNVLGSDGSVVPLFQEQIAEGGPVTVTHPEMTRYFITPSEAVHLVLQAAFMGTGGEVFWLDSGKPVRIIDLAHRLIEAAGLRPELDIPIVITAPRPGEKIHEEFAPDAADWMPTAHATIMRLRSAGRRSGSVLDRLEAAENRLAHLPPGEADALVRATLTELVPEFHPASCSDPFIFT
ncbi:MAG TPA: polysaccharide biosynthesis protein [Candidatus Polarisedimenticolia bacterium]|nr:polysaccharide biosynthesis protein [Candidatus Polarisedimenticolia bacterium]